MKEMIPMTKQAKPLEFPPEHIVGDLLEDKPYCAERFRVKRPVTFYISKFVGGDAPRGHLRIESDDGRVLVELETSMCQLAEAMTGTSAPADALISLRVK